MSRTRNKVAELLRRAGERHVESEAQRMRNARQGGPSRAVMYRPSAAGLPAGPAVTLRGASRALSILQTLHALRTVVAARVAVRRRARAVGVRRARNALVMAACGRRRTGAVRVARAPHALRGRRVADPPRTRTVGPRVAADACTRAHVADRRVVAVLALLAAHACRVARVVRGPARRSRARATIGVRLALNAGPGEADGG